MDPQNLSFVEGPEDGDDVQNDLFENQDREEQKEFNKCSSISRDEDKCNNKNEIINETDSVNLIENEINAFCSPGQEEEEFDQDPCNEELEEKQSYMSAGCSEADSSGESDVKLTVIFFIFMLTTLIQPPDNIFHRKAFSNKYIHSVNGKSRRAVFHGSSQDPENNRCNNQGSIPNILSKTSFSGNISLETVKDESYEICCECNSNRHLSDIEGAVTIENSAAKDLDSSGSYGVQISRYESIYSFPNIDNDNCSIPGYDRLGNTSLDESSDATNENIKIISKKKTLPYDRSSKEINLTADEKNRDCVTNNEKLTEEPTHYQSASLFKVKQNTATLDTKLLDLLFHPAFSRSYHQIAVFLLNGVINNEEDPEPDDENVLNECHDNNIEFNETQVATNTEIAERHVTSVEEDGSNGDDLKGDQLPFVETLLHEADTLSSNGVDSARSYSINGGNGSNNGVTDYNVIEEENQNIISNESLAIIVVPNQNGHIPQNLLLTEVEYNDLNLENSTLENSCVVKENKKAI